MVDAPMMNAPREGRDDVQGKVGADFAASKGFKSAFVVHDKTAYGQGIAEFFQQEAQAKGLTIAGFLPVGFARSTAGEYAGNIFWVVGFALLASWLVAVIFTPYMGVKLLPAIKPVGWNAAIVAAAIEKAEPEGVADGPPLVAVLIHENGRLAAPGACPDIERLLRAAGTARLGVVRR